VKSSVDLCLQVLRELGTRCGVATLRDERTLRERVEHEGLGYITLTLPQFASDFERSLEEKWVVPGSFASFPKRGRSGLPAFLSGFLHHVFDSDGVLRAEPSVDCILAVRQITLLFKKELLPCAQAREAAAIEAFVQCDEELPDRPPYKELNDLFARVAECVVKDLGLDQGDLDEMVLLGRHGPGSTVERVRGNQKWLHLDRWPSRLEEAGLSKARLVWDTRMGDLFDGAPVLGPESPMRSLLVDPVDETPVRVTLVPKTQKSPRVIAVEPVSMQFAQQALRDVLCTAVERNELTAGHVNFRDQAVNQDLALNSSSDGRLATLDMKEASDRVSLWHSRVLFAGAPAFARAVHAARSERAELPDGRWIVLRKFASMGSALCFPVEALVFFTSIIAIRLAARELPATRRSIAAMREDVYVYGDDLIVPADEAPLICDGLEALGLLINRRKSFWKGNFRESCGVDAYDGHPVTPVYVRRRLPANRGDASEIVSAIATANQLEKAGLRRAARTLRESVERIIGPLPMVKPDSPALGWTSPSETLPVLRWNRDLQRAEARVWVAVPPDAPDALEGYGALAKCLRAGYKRVHPIVHLDEPSLPRGHLDVSPRPYALALKRRWVPTHEVG